MPPTSAVAMGHCTKSPATAATLRLSSTNSDGLAKPSQGCARLELGLPPSPYVISDSVANSGGGLRVVPALLGRLKRSKSCGSGLLACALPGRCCLTQALALPGRLCEVGLQSPADEPASFDLAVDFGLEVPDLGLEGPAALTSCFGEVGLLPSFAAQFCLHLSINVLGVPHPAQPFGLAGRTATTALLDRVALVRRLLNSGLLAPPALAGRVCDSGLCGATVTAKHCTLGVGCGETTAPFLGVT